MTIQQQVVLRYRADGHLRFDVPAVVAGPQYHALVVDGLREVDGLYRVALSRSGKLSIRYDSAVCAFATVVQRLYALLKAVPAQAGAAVTPAARALGTFKLPARVAASWSRLKTWTRAKYQEAKETVWATRILSKRAASAITSQPQWITEFFKDLLTLYLLKIHWQQITHVWLRNPWRYRYEWAATLYLIYLQVRSKLPAATRS